jgi:hypothetical protein
MLPLAQRELARHGTLPKDCWDVTSVEKPDGEMTALDSMEEDSSLKEIPASYLFPLLVTLVISKSQRFVQQIHHTRGTYFECKT